MNKVTETVSGNDILYIPCEFVTAIIVGSKFPKNRKSDSLELSDKNKLDWYELVIGKSHPKPYLVNQSKEVFIFKDSCIISTSQICESCSEPLSSRKNLCPWCSITKAHEDDAEKSNPFRMLDSMGLLKGYMESAGKIKK
jgi:hypothetical protein